MIFDVEYAGDDERVDVFNNGEDNVNISGWVLRDKNNTSTRYVFPSNTVLGVFPDDSADAYVYTHSGTGRTYTFNSQTELWNDCGAALELLNGSGQVVATYAYGTHCTGDDCP